MLTSFGGNQIPRQPGQARRRTELCYTSDMLPSCNNRLSRIISMVLSLSITLLSLHLFTRQRESTSANVVDN